MPTISDDVKPCNLTEIMHRHAATTGGEWYVGENDGAIVNGEEQIAEVSTSDADACFIAYAHQDVPAMAAEIERLRGAVFGLLMTCESELRREIGSGGIARLRALLPPS